jgi:hypothetical protein
MLKQLICWLKTRKENKYKTKLLAHLESEKEGLFRWLCDNKYNEDIGPHTYGWYSGSHFKLCELITAIKHDEIN